MRTYINQTGFVPRMFKGKTVLITGGTGFLGRSLIRRILEQNPHSIRAFSRDEVKHHKLEQEFGKDDRIRTLIGDVRDYDRLRKAMKGVDIVIHAAAKKRIDILEYNVEEVIKTNIIGTLNVVNACLENDVEKAVFVSTDKACAPVNTYGACKFVAERIFTESNYSKGSARTVFTCVRYGNVLASTGSVIPFFRERIESGEALPLTHDEMTRFFITPDQAVDLIFTALAKGVGGEVFIPKLPAFRITTLIDALFEIHGKKCKVEIIGIRPGEKLHEVMVNRDEVPRTFEYNGYFVIRSQIENYQQIKNDPLAGKLKPFNHEEYNSQHYLVDKDEAVQILRESGILD